VTTSSSAALVAHALHVELRGRPVLHGLSFEARFGELLAVLGPNGAGKSTLLRALSGLLPHRGTVHNEGQDVRELSASERARRVSFVPQQSALSAPLSVHAVVSLGRYAYRPALSGLRTRLSQHDEQAVQQALLDCDVAELAGRAFSDLSSGEQKRVLLARALCTEARTLLLDEPTATLDIEHALRLFVLLRKLATRGRAVVLVLHQLEHALAFCDRALLLSQGHTLAFGTTLEVLTPANVLALHRVELVPAGAPGFRLPEPP
jgi:iron complex transport system ATP-binding protein